MSEELKKAGGDRKIYFVAASKMNDAERVRAAVNTGVLYACGENKVQEFLEKEPLGAYEGAEKHFIGHLQTNKVSKIVGRVSLIQSAGSEHLLEEISKCAEKKGIVQDCLIEINIGGEEQKSGIPPHELPSLLEECSHMGGVRIRGLMCIPPVCEENGGNLKYFQKMHKLFVDNSTKKYDNVFMDFLSMGMSDDYLDAVSCGANMVRIGSSLFGKRNYAT
ncbi:MAG: YggS family pyridoxal phosphate-dependent enzyme [Oscillospiraceae bacterium]|nr:YggS family pyridoxal phosphate-dependent enzyme [Oscillospiraceae bacterium]